MSRQDFDIFFRANYTRMYYVAFGILHDSELSKDIVSSAFEHIYRHHDEIPDSCHTSYLYNMVKNKCVDHYRQQAVRDRYAQYYLQHYETSEELNELEKAERIENVKKAIELLPERNREVLKACLYSGKKYSDVGKQFGITEDCVKKHVMKAIKTIRKKIVKDL